MVIADFQTRGRGRQQRRWEAPPRTSLLLSLLLRPSWPVTKAQWLTMSAGLAIASAIEAYTSLEVGLKWPNDIMLRDMDKTAPRWRKAGGILLEAVIEDGQLKEGLLGLGLNVNIRRQELPESAMPATSLLAAAGQTFDRLALLAHILHHLELRYEESAAGRSPQPDWDGRLITRNQQVSVVTGEGIVQGMALGSDEWGSLLVRTSDGALRRFSAGDVTLTH
jgi:BirA family biotin operon repressor/biotin-[acetyl-CoA-carboxylase] ligase